jgi:hypothetical protein
LTLTSSSSSSSSSSLRSGGGGSSSSGGGGGGGGGEVGAGGSDTVQGQNETREQRRQDMRKRREAERQRMRGEAERAALSGLQTPLGSGRGEPFSTPLATTASPFVANTAAATAAAVPVAPASASTTLGGRAHNVTLVVSSQRCGSNWISRMIRSLGVRPFGQEAMLDFCTTSRSKEEDGGPK